MQKWAERPAAWFAQAEAQFLLAAICNELTTFYHVISQLAQQHVTEVGNIITSPPQQDPYTKLKTELVSRLCPSRSRKWVIESHRSSWGTSEASHRTLRIIWASRLPANIQTTLADMPEVGLDAATVCADRFTEAVSPSTIASISQRQDNT
jgi:hypothetical protein